MLSSDSSELEAYLFNESSSLRCNLASLFFVVNGSKCIRFLILVLNLFLIELSVLPQNSLAITAHLLPWIYYSLKIFRSSSRVHSLLLILGSRHLNQCCLHYLAMRPGRPLATYIQLRVPNTFTRSMRIFSSSAFQVPFCDILWLILFSSNHRLWHFTSGLLSSLLIVYHDLWPKVWDSIKSLSSYMYCSLFTK